METRQRHLILAEDEERTRRALTLIMKQAGWRVTSACDGFDTIQKLANCVRNAEPVDLLLLDIFMPKLSGFQVIDELTKLRVETPLVVITGLAEDETMTQLKTRG